MVIVLAIILSALIALIGRNRKIGWGWGFILCLFLSPIVGLIIILFSKKNDTIEFVEVENKKNKL